MQLRRAKLVSDRSSVVKFFDRNIIVAMMYVFPSKPCKPRYVSLGLKMFNWFSISTSSRGLASHVQPGISSEVGLALMIFSIIVLVI